MSYLHCLPSVHQPLICLNHTQQAKAYHPTYFVLTHMQVYVCTCAREEVVTCKYEVRCKVYPKTGHESPKGELRFSSSLSLTSALDGGGQSTSRAGRFVPRKDTVPTVQEAGWAPGPVWTRVENLAPTGIQCPQEVDNYKAAAMKDMLESALHRAYLQEKKKIQLAAPIRMSVQYHLYCVRSVQLSYTVTSPNTNDHRLLRLVTQMLGEPQGQC